jgi:hypothetical protein
MPEIPLRHPSLSKHLRSNTTPFNLSSMKFDALTDKDLRITPRKTLPIQRKREQERIIISHLLYGNDEELSRLDKAEKHPALQPEVRELISLCKEKVRSIFGRSGSPACNCAVPQASEE